MKYLDLTLATPAENLACDEALLDSCEEGHCAGEILRFWEPQRHFVVVGYANKVATEVNVAACEARGIPILRRCSGGGTVLQGPGCLNYSLILKIDAAGPLHSIASTNRFIMDRNRAAIESALHNCGFPSPGLKATLPMNLGSTDCPLPPSLSPSEGERVLSGRVRGNQLKIEVRGHTDLVVDGRKFSGNSQRRRRRFLLFHGTFLLDFDLSLVEALLPLPSKQPTYRQNRTHAEFLTNLSLPANEVKSALRRAWNAEELLDIPPLEKIAALPREKYEAREWNFKF